MTRLVSASDVKALVNTALSDANLEAVIDRIEAQITAKIGAPQTDAFATSLTVTRQGGGHSLFLPTEIYSVTSITEDDYVLDSDQYQTWGGGVVERLPSGGSWGDRCVVVYKPVDDRPVRKEVIIDLVRIVIQRTTLKQESIAGEYSYTAPDNWNAEFRKAMRRLMFQAM